MASSKASMLKNGAKKASMGLFTGMQKLSEIEAAKEEKTPEKASEKVVEKIAEEKPVEVKKIEEPKPAVKAEPVEKKIEAPKAEEANDIKTQVIDKSQDNTEVSGTEQQISEVENRPEQSIVAQQVISDSPAPQNIEQQPTSVEYTNVNHRPIQSIEAQQPLPQQPNIQAVTAPEMNLSHPSAQPMNYQQAPVQQVQVQPTLQQIPQAPVTQPQNIAYSQPQQPIYNNQPQYAQVQPQQSYVQPAMNYPQQQYNQPVHEMQNGTSRAAKAPKQEKNSRYEKDKFLLLDIRGYRDYVEHMAKAANMSATKYIRNLIEQDMRVNHDIYEEQKRLEEMFKGRI